MLGGGDVEFNGPEDFFRAVFFLGGERDWQRCARLELTRLACVPEFSILGWDFRWVPELSQPPNAASEEQANSDDRDEK